MVGEFIGDGLGGDHDGAGLSSSGRDHPAMPHSATRGEQLGVSEGHGIVNCHHKCSLAATRESRSHGRERRGRVDDVSSHERGQSTFPQSSQDPSANRKPLRSSDAADPRDADITVPRTHAGNGPVIRSCHRECSGDVMGVAPGATRNGGEDLLGDKGQTGHVGPFPGVD